MTKNKKSLIAGIIAGVFIILFFTQRIFVNRVWNKVQQLTESRYSILIDAEKVRLEFPFHLKLSNISLKQNDYSLSLHSENLLVFWGKNHDNLLSEISKEEKFSYIKEILLYNCILNFHGNDIYLDEVDLLNKKHPELTVNTGNFIVNTEILSSQNKAEEIVTEINCNIKNLKPLENTNFVTFKLNSLDGGLNTKILYNSESGYLRMDGKLFANDLSFLLPLLSTEELDNNRFNFDFILEAPVSSLQIPEYIKLTNGLLNYNDVPAEVNFLYSAVETEPFIKADGKLTDCPVQEIFSAIPDAIKGELSGSEFEGKFSWSGGIIIPLKTPENFQWNSHPELDGLKIAKITESSNIFKLTEQFIHTIPYPGKSLNVIIPDMKNPGLDWMLAVSEQTESQIAYWRNWTQRNKADKPVVINRSENSYEYNENYKYVRLDDMSLWIPKAVLTGEDGDFFYHNGINWLTFEQAMRNNIKNREMGPGASTITMQTIKNVFLNRSRVLDRKIKEAFLVYLTEMIVPVPKERILEIYLNIIEYGPGIFGIEQACQHYFGKSPGDINAGEAVWLTSILPAPSRYYQFYEEGKIPDEWFEHMKYYLYIMLQRGRMNREEYEKAIISIPVFKKQDEEIMTDS